MLLTDLLSGTKVVSGFVPNPSLSRTLKGATNDAPSHGKWQKKRGLDRETFIQSGLRLALGSAKSDLTYRDIGKDLGIDATAIYRHFRNKDDLLEQLLDRILMQVCECTATPVEDWERRLEEFAEHTLRSFLANPPIALVANSYTTNGPGELATMELILECFAQAGLRGAQLASQYAVFASYLISSSVGLVRDYLDSPDDLSGTWFGGPLATNSPNHLRTAELQAEILNLDQRALFIAGARQLIRSAKQLAAAPA